MEDTLNNEFFIGKVLIEEKRLESTNAFAMQLLQQGDPEEGTVVYSAFQTQGKGQFGQSWESQAGKNLTFSIILRPDFIKPDQQFILNKAITLGLHDALSAHLPGDLKIKWPNDLYYKTDKLAGILIENILVGNEISGTVVGIGINVNQTEFERLPNPISLKQITGKTFDLKILLFEVCKTIEMRYLQLQAGHIQNLDSEYQSLLFQSGGFHDFDTKQGKITAMIKGVDESGKLVLKDQEGKIEKYSNKELRFLL